MANTEKIVVQVVVQGEKDLKRLEKRTGTTTKSFGKMAAGVVAAVAAFRQITQIVGQSIRSFRDFEFQLAKVRAVTGASNTEFRKLSSTAQELGRTTFFTATQVAELQTNFAKLGFTTTEIIAAQEATLQLATATGSDLARSAIVAGSAIRGFGLDARETQRVVDVMAVAFTSSALDIEKFQTSMTKVAPIAAAAGISIETTSAVMGTLTDAGIEASIAGTSLRNIFLKMQDPASDLSKHLGFTVKSSADLEKALKQLNSEGLSNADMMQLVDLRQVAAFQTMVSGADKVLSLTDALENADGAGSEMAEMIGQTLEGAFLRLKSATEGLQIALVEGFVGQALTKVLNVGADVLNFLTNFRSGVGSVNEELGNATKIYAAQSVQLQNMADRFDVLSAATNRTAEEDEELQGILVALQKEFGRSVISVNNKTNALILNRQALDDVIAKTVLLADTEALKLVHKLNQIEREIKVEQNKKDTIDETIESITGSTAAMAENNATLSAQADQTNVTAQAFDEFGSLISTATTNQNDLLDSQLESQSLGTQINELDKERLEITNLLNEAGFTQTEIERLLNQELNLNSGFVGTNTDKIIENTEAKKKGLDLDRELLDFKLELLMQGELSEEQAAEVNRNLINQRIEDLKKELDFIVLSGEERKRIMQEIHDLQESLNKDDVDTRQKQIDGVSQLGQQLITLAGEDEKMQGIRKAGIQISAAAAIANNLLALSNAAVGVSEQSKLLFPGNIVAMLSTVATIMSLFANIKALKDSFGDGGVIQEYANGGMVHGRSHAQGGEKFAVGGRVVELEGGEAVINKRSTSMFRNQLSAMNAAGGGVKFADGGMINQPSFSQQEFNVLGQNQMMGAMGGASKVVVVESDITSVQREVSVVESDAKI